MTFLRPPDDADVVYETYGPFAHVEGRYEWCRIHAATHGVLDAFILVDRDPVTVYVATDAGEAYMRDRYPECDTFRVGMKHLGLADMDDRRTVVGALRADEGPVREVHMTLSAPPGARPRAVPYGGDGAPVWGSRRWTCWGVDVVLDGTAHGHLASADGNTEALRGEPALITLGSFGRIAPLA